MWQEHLNDWANHDRIYADVVNKCCIRYCFWLMYSSNCFPFYLIPIHAGTLEAHVSSSLSALLAKLDNICVLDATQRVKIVVYFDEAQ